MSDGVGIRIEKLHKDFSQKKVIENLNLDIAPGSFVSVVGPSGCGKSTLLRLVAELETPSSGTIQKDSGDATNFSFVFQDPNLLAWRTVYENVRLPFELSKSLQVLSPQEQHKRISAALTKVHLQDSQNLFPHQLSGGMKMRVSLARALVNSPQLLLMDEPFAALDESTRFEMQRELHTLWQKERMTVIFVTHSLFESAFLSERIIMLKGAGAQIVLDQKLTLPQVREESLRTTEAFNKIVAGLSERLRA
ncbi:ABC transporter ATP-binding protein [Bdellovibrio bacteriovorus]|uniref:ABC transporter ATP-binding protein n=1 Tax=Bdellovibrio bacteriovorus TaxID=959 RepID=UPI0021CDF0E9|nr:ABC transporter ATP-binding protein [Bdellovibrio bacteriovorus]UXR63522.1 ABC transporter ATP-binding protein [Bdellovibrio bacteriovorus]